MPNAHLNGIDIYFERSGVVGNPRLLFISGSGATLAGTAPMIGKFSAQFDVLAHDQRGLGLTSVPDGPYTMAQYAADAAALAEHVGWTTYRVIGTSFGGMVAQELAVTLPERIERLALLCTSPGGAGGSSYPLHTLADLAASERAAIGLRILDSRFTAEWLAEHPNDRVLAEMNAQRGAAPKPAEVVRGEALQIEARSHHDVWDRLSAVTCPTLVASGRYDGIAPVANGEAIAGRVRGARMNTYDGGHAFFYQDRSAFPEIIDFLLGDS